MGMFSEKQRKLLKIAKKKGFLTLTDFIAIFSSHSARKENIDRFIALGILKVDPVVLYKLNLNKEKLKELEQY